MPYRDSLLRGRREEGHVSHHMCAGAHVKVRVCAHLRPCVHGTPCPPPSLLHTPTRRHHDMHIQTHARTHARSHAAGTHARAHTHACGRAAYEYACPKSMPKPCRYSTPRVRVRVCVCVRVCVRACDIITRPPSPPPHSLPCPFFMSVCVRPHHMSFPPSPSFPSLPLFHECVRVCVCVRARMYSAPPFPTPAPPPSLQGRGRSIRGRNPRRHREDPGGASFRAHWHQITQGIGLAL